MIGEDPNYVQALFGAAQASGGSTLPSSGGNAGDIASSILGKAPQITNEDITRALSPTLERTPMQMPSAFTTPNPQAGPAQMDNRQVVGKGNARAQGIGNAVSATTRAVTTFVNARRNNEQRQNATKVARLMQAQQGKDQAAQLMQTMKGTDPGFQAALQSYNKNDEIVKTMLSDPKFAKVVEKGFQISLTDPSQNKTEHHAAVQAGIDMFNKIRGKQQQQQQVTPAQAAQMAQRFQQQMPTQLAPNQQAMARLQILQQQQKMYSDIARTVLPSIIRAEGAQRTEQMRGMVELQKQQNTNMEWDRRNALVYKEQMAKMDQEHQLSVSRLYTEASLRIKTEQARLQMEGQDPAKVFHASDESARTWSSAIASQQTSLDTAKASLAAAQSDGKHDDKTLASMQADVTVRENELEQSRRQADYYKNFYKILNLKAGNPKAPDDSENGEKKGEKDDSTDGNAGPESDSVDSNDLGAWSKYSNPQQ
jgi:hypothetical protein